jgi:hypothetical protein
MVNSTRNQVQERDQGKDPEAQLSAYEGSTNCQSRSNRPCQDSILGQSDHFRMYLCLDEPIVARRVPPVGVKKSSYHDQVQAIDYQSRVFRGYCPSKPVENGINETPIRKKILIQRNPRSVRRI